MGPINQSIIMEESMEIAFISHSKIILHPYFFLENGDFGYSSFWQIMQKSFLFANQRYGYFAQNYNTFLLYAILYQKTTGIGEVAKMRTIGFGAA